MHLSARFVTIPMAILRRYTNGSQAHGILRGEMTGKQLKKRRAALKLTQKELALKLQVKPNTVARWERELRSIPAFLDLALQTIEREAARLIKAEVDLIMPTGRSTGPLRIQNRVRLRNRKSGRPRKGNNHK
jgi:transcriptional regulator with XRE-family HTH domain